MIDQDHLFSKQTLGDFLEQKISSLKHEIKLKSKDEILSQDTEIVKQLSDRYKLEPPVIRQDDIYTTKQEIEVDISQDPNRLILDRTQPHYVRALEVSFHIPFDGDPDLFQWFTSPFTTVLPRGEVINHEVVVKVKNTDNDVNVIKKEFERNFNDINLWLGWACNQANGFNDSLLETINNKVQERKDELDRDDNTMLDLGFPTK